MLEGKEKKKKFMPCCRASPTLGNVLTKFLFKYITKKKNSQITSYQIITKRDYIKLYTTIFWQQQQQQQKKKKNSSFSFHCYYCFFFFFAALTISYSAPSNYPLIVQRRVWLISHTTCKISMDSASH